MHTYTWVCVYYKLAWHLQYDTLQASRCTKEKKTEYLSWILDNNALE